MTTESVPIEEAVKKLYDVTGSNNTRLKELEKKLMEIQISATEQTTELTNKVSSEMASLQIMMVEQMEKMQKQTREWQDTARSKIDKSEEQWNYVTFEMESMKTDVKKICEAITTQQTTEIDNNQSEDGINRTLHIIDNPMTRDSPNSRSQCIHRESQPTHTIVIPPTAAIPVFSGNITDNPRQFLIRVKEYAESINRWNEQSLLNGISQFLRDTALEWYCQIRTSHRRPQTWTEFSTIFLTQFNSPIRRARREEQWKKCKQEERETIDDFMVRLREVWREQKPNETEVDLRKHVLCRMRNNLMMMIGMARGGTLEEILEEAHKAEELLYERVRRRYDSNTEEGTPGNTLSTATYHGDNQFEVQAMSAHQNDRQFNSYAGRTYAAQNGRNDRSAPRYTNYAHQGTNNQRQTQSPYAITCYACGRKGHTRNNCPGQFNRYQQRNAGYYKKNENGAQSGRD